MRAERSVCVERPGWSVERFVWCVKRFVCGELLDGDDGLRWDLNTGLHLG